MRSIKDKVRVTFLGEVHEGHITDFGGHGGVFYQVLLHNEHKTCVWFADYEVMDA